MAIDPTYFYFGFGISRRRNMRYFPMLGSTKLYAGAHSYNLKGNSIIYVISRTHKPECGLAEPGGGKIQAFCLVRKEDMLLAADGPAGWRGLSTY